MRCMADNLGGTIHSTTLITVKSKEENIRSLLLIKIQVCAGICHLERNEGAGGGEGGFQQSLCVYAWQKERANPITWVDLIFF